MLSIIFWGTYNMNWSPFGSEAQKEATMPSLIFGIILDNFAFFDNCTNFCESNNSFRPNHLINGVRQKSNLFLPAFRLEQ